MRETQFSPVFLALAVAAAASVVQAQVDPGEHAINLPLIHSFSFPQNENIIIAPTYIYGTLGEREGEGERERERMGLMLLFYLSIKRAHLHFPHTRDVVDDDAGGGCRCIIPPTTHD